MPDTAKENSRKMVLTVSEDEHKKIQSTMEEAGLLTEKDYYNTMATIFDWIVEEVKKGRTITSMDEETGSYVEVKMPFMDYLRQKL